MMRIAVISDTHCASPTPELVDLFETTLLEADVLLHCGDFTGEETLSLLMTHPRFHAVAGNMDGMAIQAFLPSKTVIRVNSLRIGLVHGWGRGGDLHERVGESFKGSADVVCFGHSHRRTLIRQAEGPILINPGSLLAPRDDRPGLAMIEWTGAGAPRVLFLDL